MPKVAETVIGENMNTTVPKPIRTALDLEYGDRVEWWIEDGDVIFRKVED